MDILTLNEESNTSLMYHKLFPDMRLLRDLEGKGYKFEMGEGLKLHRQYYAAQQRNGGQVTKQRTLQSLVILKDGKLFRKIPKSAWTRLVDPSDKDSKTYGEMFMRKLLNHEISQYRAKVERHNKTSANKIVLP